ncbi:hypothetical protein NHX12_032934 [Muraenolepis orangiensis]|uniref:Pre-mRNA-splicing factor 38B n=1 Tax=Muraenolepis orangiensis TaxID=630683 RepID=A0A9Q0E2G4_9TELE|nr:hypothetical protein NHX12_032934 [Muraenolepis orangiensis]
MANRTVKDANSIHGTNPQYLVEKIIRTRIYESKYWKEECFGLTAELVVDKAMELKFVGGVYGGNIKPTPFLCLTLKMLQIQPEKDIIVEFIKNEDFKYVRLLGAMYMRLTGTSVDCYKYLEPLYNDYRKIKSQNRNGEFEVMHVDEFIDELLHSERMCDIILPRLQVRGCNVYSAPVQPSPNVSELCACVCVCVCRKGRSLRRPNSWTHASALWRKTWTRSRAVMRRTRRKKSQREYRLLSLIDGVTVTTTGPAARPHHATDAAAPLGGGADHPRGEARLRGESAIAARAPGDTGADPGNDATDPNPLVTTEVTDTAVTQSLQRGESELSAV